MWTRRIPILQGLALSPLLASVAVTGQDGSDAEPSELQRQAGAVRATPDEMRFKQIPWVTDVFEGFRLAREEKRPVFLYVVTGDPLGDC